MKSTIPIAKPVFETDDYAALRVPLETGWVVQGPHVKRFEDIFSHQTGAAHSAACSSGTSALHLALAALEIGPGDEVVVPAFTWVATANVAVYCGAKPVFADIDLDTFNVDPDALVAAVTRDTKVLLPVHLFGQPAELDPILDLAQRKDLFVVEDAACGLGAKIGVNHVGTQGDLGTFSFHPRKAVTTGEGGMVTTSSEAFDTRIRALRSHGGTAVDGRPGYLMGDFNLLGFNYRMTDIQGALGITQMAKAQRLFEARSRWAARYTEKLAGLDWLATPKVQLDTTHGWQSYVCLFRPEYPTLANVDALHARRNALMAHLASLGIQTRPGTHAVHALGYYREHYETHPHQCPNAWLADRLSLAIPLFPTMTEAQQDRVVDALRAWCP